jgi:hypothetical protein
MNKTVYVPDDEAETWEKARKFANDRLSPVILQALKEFIMAKEAEASEAAGFERIEIEFEDADHNDLPKRKAFRGTWVFSPGEPFRVTDDEDDQVVRSFAVAVAAKGNVVVLHWGTVAGVRAPYYTRFHVFPSFEMAAEDANLNRAIRAAIKKRGVPIEELDI